MESTHDGCVLPHCLFVSIPVLVARSHFSWCQDRDAEASSTKGMEWPATSPPRTDGVGVVVVGVAVSLWWFWWLWWLWWWWWLLLLWWWSSSLLLLVVVVLVLLLLPVDIGVQRCLIRKLHMFIVLRGFPCTWKPLCFWKFLGDPGSILQWHVLGWKVRGWARNSRERESGYKEHLGAVYWHGANVQLEDATKKTGCQYQHFRCCDHQIDRWSTEYSHSVILSFILKFWPCCTVSSVELIAAHLCLSLLSYPFITDIFDYFGCCTRRRDESHAWSHPKAQSDCLEGMDLLQTKLHVRMNGLVLNVTNFLGSWVALRFWAKTAKTQLSDPSALMIIWRTILPCSRTWSAVFQWSARGAQFVSQVYDDWRHTRQIQPSTVSSIVRCLALLLHAFIRRRECMPVVKELLPFRRSRKKVNTEM